MSVIYCGDVGQERRLTITPQDKIQLERLVLRARIVLGAAAGLATHWSCGISKASVQRLWNAHGLKPHLVKTFKLSNDPRFIEKLEDGVGLYLNPPEHALVFSLDEKSQIQALDRTQPGLPMKKGRAGTMTHDYKRNSTTTLFAALDVLNVLKGQVIGQCMKRHRHQEFLAFLKTIDRNTPQDLAIHCIVDNHAAHKKEEVRRWLRRHPRFHFHFIPTSSSGLNLVQRTRTVGIKTIDAR
jgi:transposase